MRKKKKILFMIALLCAVVQGAWADATVVNLTEDTDEVVGTAARWYVNMPATGERTVNIPSNVSSFKVYDDGGSEGNYSNGCDGTLTLTAPEGYRLQLSGSIISERGLDKLTVFDVIDNIGIPFDNINGLSGDNDIPETIPTVVSTGRIMTIYFYSDDDANYAGLDLTVTLIKVMELANNADNSTDISNANGCVANVTLAGRTLYKDGDWNTLCLPFNVAIAGSALDGATALPLSSASISGTTLNLTFGDAVDELVAGTPYIIKWAKADGYDQAGEDTRDIKNPVFSGVTIDATDRGYDTETATPAVTTDERVRFVGTYKSTSFDGVDNSILFLGTVNTLYYPLSSASIGAQRAYFKIGDDGDLLARRLTAFNIDFGEDAPTMIGHTAITEKAGTWFTLDGRKLDRKPSQRGIYVNNGKKVVVK